jgi:tRNA(Ile)-lysidine synthase
MRLRRVEPILRRALRGVRIPGPAHAGAPARLLVAVSGGADSTALLLGLHHLRHELGFELHAAHLHHGLRGAEADADLDFVRALCARLGVALACARWDTPARMRRRGLAGQSGLRTLRREFLQTVRRRVGAHAIVTAHTADDQLETLLMRLGRGTGLVGLAGMKPRCGPWLKPLLGATRAQIEADLVRAGQSWREDRSNRDASYTRSRVRHEAVPALVRALMPGVSTERGRALLAARASGAAAAAHSSSRVVERLARRVLTRACRIQRGMLSVETRRLHALPDGIRAAALRQLWRRTCPASSGLTRLHLEALGRLIDSARGGAIIHLPGGWWAERDRDVIRFRLGSPAPGRAKVRLPLPGRLDWEDERFEAGWTTGAEARRRWSAAAGCGEFFAAEGLEGSPVVRRARSDERFVPFGRTRSVELGRFLNKQGVAKDVRQNPTVLADAGGILWVVGVRRSARAPVSAGTRRVLWVRTEHHD